MEKYICRCWTETTLNGFTSYFEEFETEEEANEYGKTFVSLIKSDELTREYEVYKG